MCKKVKIFMCITISDFILIAALLFIVKTL